MGRDHLAQGGGYLVTQVLPPLQAGLVLGAYQKRACFVQAQSIAVKIVYVICFPSLMADPVSDCG